VSYKSFEITREVPELPQAHHGDWRLRMRRTLLAFVIATLFIAPSYAAQFSIEAVKAAYLFRFASYVQWPEAARDEGHFTIGVVGAEDVAVHLEHLLNGMSVQGRPAKVRRVKAAPDLAGVHILYVGDKVFRSSRPLRAIAIEKPILLVTDARDGLDGGGVINFIEVNRNLRFEISLDAAERSGLKIDSALLSVAARVDSRRPQ
jgi:hypothetical protein